jgi:rod shape-determining protein MreD
MRRALVIFATCVLLWAVVSQLNHALTRGHVYLWIAGLFITFSALTLPLGGGLTATFMTGLLCDAGTPLAFGTQALLFAAAHVVIFNLRERVPRDETVARVTIASLANLTLFLVFAFLQVGRLPSAGAVWPRIFFDLLCSQLFLVLVAPWFFALQARALELARPLFAQIGRDLD